MTAQEVFNNAMAHMSELKNTGAVDTQSTAEYLYRAPALLTTAQYEIISILNDTKSQSYIAYPDPITAMTDEMTLEPYICATVLVYLFISRLLATEEPNTANYFAGLYEENKRHLLKRTPSTPIKRKNVYGGEELWRI